MYLLAKSGSYKSYGNGDINSYISFSCSNEDSNELFAVSDLKPKVLLAIEKLREKKKRPDISIVTDSWQKTEICASNLTESAINELIEQKGIVNKKTQKSTENEYPCKIQNRKSARMYTTRANGQIFWWNIFTNAIQYWKQLYQLKKVKISAIKSGLDCEISALSDKTNTLLQVQTLHWNQ